MNASRQRTLGGGGHHVLDYLKRMQAENPAFFYVVQNDNDHSGGNTFWADATCRMNYSYFGDTVTFDTRYKTNRYRVPFASFTGLNHHGQPVLFGCALILNESETSFIWLFQTWLHAMSGCQPVSITTDPDRLIQIAVAQVLPETRHRFCKWGIFRETQEKLAQIYQSHPTFETEFQKCINEPETIDEFESSWQSLLERYYVMDNEWLQSMYNARQQWVPVYMRDTFFGEFSITDRSGGHSFFDGYVNASTTIQMLIKQYEKALASWHEKEFKADYDTTNCTPFLKTPSPMEKQAANLYTRRVFMKFQEELVETLANSATKIDDAGAGTTYHVSKFGEDHKARTVSFNSIEMKASCSCQMFEYSGIICRHILAVFRAKNVLTLPSQYILKRWTRNAKTGPAADELASAETSDLAGHESTKFRHDAQLIKEIVGDVLEKLKNKIVSTDSSMGLVGLNSRIEQIKPFLCMDLWDTVQIVGIWGMGGIGKTTLAEAIFDQFSGEFDGKYIAKDVRRKSETVGGLEDLQKEMLSTILSEKLEVAGPNIPQFTKGRVRRMQVLIVLDDVNKDEQLEGLIGGLDQYGPGSRIVVTTRDKRVLEKFGVEKIYRVNGLKFDEALKHFCNFAFKENHCPEDLYQHSWRVVWYANGNPLVLKVLGSSLYLKRKSHWENVLDDLNRICEYDIHGIYDTLKISFNELTRKEKSVFLDIACFLEGEDKDFVSRILDDSGSHRLDVLVDKSLITVSENCLQMHDLLQEMGREIVRQESEEEPGRRSRLWDPKEIRRVLKHTMGTDAIEGIFLDLSKIKGINLDPGAFTNMSNLRLLKFYVLSTSIEEQLSYSKVQLPNGLNCLPKKLRYLHWDTYPLRALPSNFKPKNVVELNLRFSKVEQLWEGEKAFVPSSIQNFKYLSALSFEGCKSIRSFPSNLHFVCPVTINFSSCVNLIEFPQISGKITRLYLGQSAIEEVPSTIECLTDLTVLDLGYCKRLKRISTRFCKLRSLVNFFLHGCLNLERFPEILEKMEYLEHINLNGSAITELPSSFENLPGLKSLSVKDCSKLDKLPDNIGNLESLDCISAAGSSISQLPSSVADSNVLEFLDFSSCKGLVSLPRSLLLGLSSLGLLEIRDCAIMEIPQEIACLSSLEVLDLSGNNFESLPASIKQLSQLSRLDLKDCKMLQSLPELPLCLKSLNLNDCKMLQSLLELPLCLKSLELRDCKMLQSLPALPLCLESLDLTGCNMLRSIPELPLCLKYLGLEECNMLRSLPELSLCLQSLEAENCKRLQSLPEIPSCLQELDASVLEKLSKPSPDLRQWYLEYLKLHPIYFGFTNCLKLNGKANNKILADSRPIIRHMAIASLRLGYENAYNEKIYELRGSLIVLPGSEIPDWFSNQSSGSSICIQLPLHSFRRNLIGFSFCAVLDFKKVDSPCSCNSYVSFQSDLEIKTLSETKHIDLGFSVRTDCSVDSDHVILCFKPCLNVGFPDGYHHTTVSLKFFNECSRNQKGHKIKRYGVCPVYANPSEIKANTFTLNFATEVWKLVDLPSASGTSDEEGDPRSDEGDPSSDEGDSCSDEGDSCSDEGEFYCSPDAEELEPSPKRICRDDQVNTP